MHVVKQFINFLNAVMISIPKKIPTRNFSGRWATRRPNNTAAGTNRRTQRYLFARRDDKKFVRQRLQRAIEKNFGCVYRIRSEKSLPKCRRIAARNSVAKVFRQAQVRGNFYFVYRGDFFLPVPIDDGIQPLPVDEKFLAHNDEFNLSLRELKPGDSIEIMRKIYGREENVTPAETPNHHHCKYKNIRVTFAGNSVVGLVSYADEIQTERGLHQDSSLDEVIAAYGRRAAVYEYDGLTLYEYAFVSAQENLAGMRFAVKNNAVDYISLRLADEEREHSLADVTDF
ncbi:MAG: hypothetical protein IJ685_09665 [Selenomonadaceae bacterium]|nr:hypothetical protein [Selenomonadaceae bacterium]